MAILQVGSGLQLRSTGATGSKEEDYENDAATIVQKCVSHNPLNILELCEPHRHTCPSNIYYCSLDE